MSTETFENCRHCVGLTERISNVNESPLIVECHSCGHREYAEIQISPDDFFTNHEVEYRRVIVCRGGEKATAEEILALRKLIPDLAELPMSEAASAIALSRYIDLGIHPLKEAQTLFAKAESIGLKTLLEDHDEQTTANQVKHGFCEPFGAPLTVGEPGEDTIIIPFGWILIGVVLVVAIVAWIL